MITVAVPSRLRAATEAAAPSIQKRRGRVIAEFQSVADARMFVSMKQCEGVDVVAMESSNPQFVICVRLLEPTL